MGDQAVGACGGLVAAYTNAGVQNVLADTADAPREDFDRVSASNLGGVWNCMKFELRQMLKQGSGAIVNCSSIGGLVCGPGRGTYHPRKPRGLGLAQSAAPGKQGRGIPLQAGSPALVQKALALSSRA